MSKRVLLGIASYLERFDSWNLAPFERIDTLDVEATKRNFSGAIIINDCAGREFTIQGLKQKLPVVLVGCGSCEKTVPTLTVSEKSVAKVAVMAFLDRGFQSIAFVGEMQNESSRELQNAFSDELRRNGIAPFIFMTQALPTQSGVAEGNQLVMRRRLVEWLASLPKETAIFAADDGLAFEVYKAASQLNLRIPEEISILGVNDDELMCRIMNPSLSSIRLPFEKMGHDAAKIIKEGVSSVDYHPSNPGNLRKNYEPMGFIARGTTKVIVAKDPVVKAAVNFIHENFMNPINVESILDELNVSRSLLERRFRDELGVTPLVELRRQRIEKARAMLSDTNERIHDMGKRCGFSSAIRFTTVFKEQVGITPTEFRKQMLPEARK